MAGVSGIGRAGGAGASRVRGGRMGGGFIVAPEAPCGTAAASPAAPVALRTMLALQEAGPEPVDDRAARQHGQAMLQSLRALQRALLGGEGDDPAALGRLANLSAGVPAASDPAMRVIVDAIALRVRLELARRGTARATNDREPNGSVSAR